MRAELHVSSYVTRSSVNVRSGRCLEMYVTNTCTLYIEPQKFKGPNSAFCDVTFFKLQRCRRSYRYDTKFLDINFVYWTVLSLALIIIFRN